MKNLNDMLYFAQVVESGSFAAAARVLGMPQSTLSRRVADLEGVLGVRLLERTTRKLALTKIGETYHGHCTALKENALAAQEAISIARTEPYGLVKVSCPISLAQTTVRPVLPEFLRRDPKVRIEMLGNNTPFEPMENGIDVALRRLGPPRAPDDLARLPSVAMSTVDGWAMADMSGPDGARYELRHRPCFAADDAHTLKHLVLDGIGLGVLPAHLCREELGEGRLQEALPGWAPVPDIFHAVFPSRRGMVPAVRALLDFLGEHAKEGINPGRMGG